MNKLWKISETACCYGFGKNLKRLSQVVLMLEMPDGRSVFGGSI
jgi:hypothetical protein